MVPGCTSVEDVKMCQDTFTVTNRWPSFWVRWLMRQPQRRAIPSCLCLEYVPNKDEVKPNNHYASEVGEANRIRLQQEEALHSMIIVVLQ